MFALNEASRALHKTPSRDVPDGRLLGEDGGRTDGYYAGEARRSHRRTDEAAQARQVAHVRGRRGRPVRRPRRPEDARPAGRRAATRRQGQGQALDRRHVAGEAQRARQRPRRQADRAGPAHGPIPAPGPSRAVRHLRGDEPPRPGEERRGRDDARQAVRRQSRATHDSAHAHERGHHACPSSTDSPSSISTRCCRTRST